MGLEHMAQEEAQESGTVVLVLRNEGEVGTWECYFQASVWRLKRTRPSSEVDDQGKAQDEIVPHGIKGNFNFKHEEKSLVCDCG